MTSAGKQAAGGDSFNPALSADGQQVTFDSIATNLVAGDTNTCAFVSGPSFTVPGQCPDIYLHRS